MLKDLNGKNVEVLPKSRKKFFENGLSKITKDEYVQMEDYINQLIDDNCKSHYGYLFRDGMHLVLGKENRSKSYGIRFFRVIMNTVHFGMDYYICK